MPRGPQYTDDELLDGLRQLAEDVGRTPPLKRDMADRGPYAPRTYQLRFGSWSQAVEAAGFTPREKGEDFEERPDGCPLCGYEDSYLDFHHWRYGENEQGCYLCRDCHDAIHEGKGQTTNTDWLPHAVEHLVARHLEYHDSTDADAILDRYNMPDIGVLVENSLPDSTSENGES